MNDGLHEISILHSDRLKLWPERMDARGNVPPIKIPDHWLRTTPELSFPWNGEFLKWQEEFRDEPK